MAELTIYNAWNMVTSEDIVQRRLGPLGLRELAPPFSPGRLLPGARGSCLGFLPDKLPNARTFVTDTGSLLLGTVLALLVVQMAQKSTDPASLMGLMLVCAVYLWDSGFALLRHLWRGENVFQGHRSHLYQRMAQLGLSHASITSLYLLLRLLMGFLGLAYVRCANDIRCVILVFAGLTLGGFTMSVYWLERRVARVKRKATSATLPE
jgi:hypothetical protein